jgi:hypothetical protein
MAKLKRVAKRVVKWAVKRRAVLFIVSPVLWVYCELLFCGAAILRAIVRFDQCRNKKVATRRRRRRYNASTDCPFFQEMPP